MGFKLWQKKTCWIPTWQGWLVILMVMVISGLAGLAWIHPFLAMNRPVASEILVIEAWMPDRQLEVTRELFLTRHCRWLALTGGPLDQGFYLAQYQTYPEMAAATLQKLGISGTNIAIIPTPKVARDRTYQSALALKEWLRAYEPGVSAINLVSLGPHARRSRLLFQLALGREMQVGIIALPDEEYDPNRWWRTSRGFRTVLGELIAYGYAAVFFRP